MRLVVDTNVLLSALQWQGTPHRLLEKMRGGTVGLVTSPALLEELAEVLNRPKFSSILARLELSPQTILDEIVQVAEIGTLTSLPSPICRDPDDDAVLATALAVQADMIVSGDADLLELHEFQDVPIVTAAEAMERIA